MCKIMSSAKYLQCYLQTISPPHKSLPEAPTPAWMVVTVLGGATTIAPVLMASISLDLKVSIEGAHAIFTGRMLHIRIERGTKEYRYGSCRPIIDWYE